MLTLTWNFSHAAKLYFNVRAMVCESDFGRFNNPATYYRHGKVKETICGYCINHGNDRSHVAYIKSSEMRLFTLEFFACLLACACFTVLTYDQKSRCPLFTPNFEAIQLN